MLIFDFVKTNYYFEHIRVRELIHLNTIHHIMPTAYVLINTEANVEEEFINEVNKLDGVKEVASVYGRYDFIVIIESENMEKVKDIITWKIRRIRSVKSTITLIKV